MDPKHPEPANAPDASDLVREFLVLNRRRTRGNPPLSVGELERWVELRPLVDLAINGRVGARPGRRALRVPTHLKVRFDAGGKDELIRASDVSEGGVFLATSRPLAVGTPLRLRLESDGETVDVEGKVVWTRQHAGERGPAGMGVCFDTLDDAQSEAVAELLHDALEAL